jgi:copper chaperone
MISNTGLRNSEWRIRPSFALAIPGLSVPRHRPIELEEHWLLKPEGNDRVKRAAAIAETQMAKEENNMSSTIKVKGMSCQHCVMSVTKALGQLEGVKNIQVDLAKGEVRFDNTKEIASDRIEKAIEDAGYGVVQS